MTATCNLTILVAVLFLSGCALLVGEEIETTQHTEPTGPIDYVQPDLGDPSPWVGRSRDELVEALGPPDGVYQARHTFADYDANIPAFTYVYFNTATSCVDAYVVDDYSKTVIKYYCR